MGLKSDAIIIGGGHNGLTCAAYLAAAGLSVQVLERRGQVGGAAVTEEFHPGFRNSVAAYTVSLLNPTVIADLELYKYGLKIVERRMANFLPLADGGHFAAGDNGLTERETARFSTKDAQTLASYHARNQEIADLLRQVLEETPPNLRKGLASLAELTKVLSLGLKLRRLSVPAMRDLLAFFSASVGDYLDQWFESEPIKALYGFDGVVGTFASPFTPGTAYVQLHHCFGEVNGKKGAWGHAIGGMGAITQAMARACEARGVRIETNATVTEVITKNGRVAGVQLEDGRVFRAPIVASNLGPKPLFTKLIDPGLLEADFRERMANLKTKSGTFRMNVALSELPNFAGLGTAEGDHHTAGIIMAPSLSYMDRAYTSARANGYSAQPVIEMLIPSTLDPTLAPPGRHVASLFCQHFDYDLPGNKGWDDCREQVADHIIATADKFAPNFKASILGRQIFSPVDLERTFGLAGGDIFHGQLTLDQLFSARPTLGHADYRMPVPGLYLVGSGAHPGGGVTGLPGRNGAQEILADVRRGKVPANA